MQNRLSQILKPESGHTVMLAVDHGYFQGPTTGLEEPGKTIEPLLPYADALMPTRGVLRECVSIARVCQSKYPNVNCTSGFGWQYHGAR
jgi:DhnA family fructose-bisphosphate aldolase class Ia